MRTRTGMVVLICGFVVGALAIGLNAGAESRVRRPAPPPPAKPAGEPQSTRLQIDIFELSCTTDQLLALNLDQIGGGDASIEQIFERLTALGQTRILSRMDDVIALPGKANLTTGHRTPVVTDIVISSGGVVTPSVNYEDVGTIATVSGQWLDGESDVAQLQMNTEFSGVARSHIEIASKVKLSVFTECSVNKSLLARSGKPILTLTNLVPDPTDEEKRVTVYVVRTVVTRIKP